MLFDLHEPLLNVGEGLLACNIVAEEDAVRTPVENSGDWSKGLLAGGVPNLQFDDLLVDLDHEAAEFHADRHLMF